ncbi:MAG: hypothetical protein DRI57_21325 [Deltaproteobacteria bacterium]|nr:MAG: hypothetical protein DRI57_21325 [Deltaproteobacteria bacterium]
MLFISTAQGRVNDLLAGCCTGILKTDGCKGLFSGGHHDTEGKCHCFVKLRSGSGLPFLFRLTVLVMRHGPQASWPPSKK